MDSIVIYQNGLICNLFYCILSFLLCTKMIQLILYIIAYYPYCYLLKWYNMSLLLLLIILCVTNQNDIIYHLFDFFLCHYLMLRLLFIITKCGRILSGWTSNSISTMLAVLHQILNMFITRTSISKNSAKVYSGKKRKSTQRLKFLWM